MSTHQTQASNPLSMIGDSYGARNIKAIEEMIEAQLKMLQQQTEGSYADVAGSLTAAQASGQAAADIDMQDANAYLTAGWTNLAAAGAAGVGVVGSVGYDCYKNSQIEAVDTEMTDLETVQDRINSGAPKDQEMSEEMEVDNNEITQGQIANMLGTGEEPVDLSKALTGEDSEANGGIIDHIAAKRDGSEEDKLDYKNLKERAASRKDALTRKRDGLNRDASRKQQVLQGINVTLQALPQGATALAQADAARNKQSMEIDRALQAAVADAYKTRASSDQSWAQQSAAALKQGTDSLSQLGQLGTELRA